VTSSRVAIAVALCMTADALCQAAPYPPSPVIASLTWHWETHRTAAPGSDLWPVTWGPDDNLYLAWGDGGGFGGTNSDARVSMGFARIEGPPEQFTATNINGGKDCESPASFPDRGKTGSLLSVGGVLYARLNMQNGEYPDVDHSLIWSEDLGRTWHMTDWVWPKGEGNFKPSSFLNFGRDYSGVPEHLGGYVYVYGSRQGDSGRVYLARVPRDRMGERDAYEFLSGLDEDYQPQWSTDPGDLYPVFEDPRGAGASVNYDPALKRYLLACYHGGPGCLGVFDAPNPWGPWTTVAYYEDWGNMGSEGEGLTCNFPQKWMSEDGLTLWCVFSVYGDGAKRGIRAHDCFNLVKATLSLHSTANADYTAGAARPAQPRQSASGTPRTPVISFTRRSLETQGETNTGFVALADIDRDGVVDIVSGLQWFSGASLSRHALCPPDATSAIDIGKTVPYDLDNDGDLDLIANRRPQELFWLENPGPPYTVTWQKHHITNSVKYPELLVFADVDGDGRDEMVGSDDGPGFGLRVYELPDDPRDPEAWSWETIDASPLHGLGIGDLNGDGRPDIVSDFVWFEHGAGGDWHRHALPCPDTTPKKRMAMQIKVCDVDGDGDEDIIMTRAHEYGALWLESSGGRLPEFTPHEILPGELPSQLHGVAYGDIDGDGDTDIFAGKCRYRHGDVGEDDPLDVFWLELRRGAEGVSWVKHQLATDLSMGFGPVIGDVDHDGDADLLMRGLGLGGSYVIGERQTNVTIFLQERRSR